MGDKYRLNTGLNYGPDKSIRREAGEVVDDLDERSVPWLLDQGHIVKVEEQDEQNQAVAPTPRRRG